MNKTLIIFASILLLLSTFATKEIHWIQIASASNIIHIRDDGTIEGTSKIKKLETVTP